MSSPCVIVHHHDRLQSAPVFGRATLPDRILRERSERPTEVSSAPFYLACQLMRTSVPHIALWVWMEPLLPHLAILNKEDENGTSVGPESSASRARGPGPWGLEAIRAVEYRASQLL